MSQRSLLTHQHSVGSVSVVMVPESSSVPATPSTWRRAAGKDSTLRRTVLLLSASRSDDPGLAWSRSQSLDLPSADAAANCCCCCCGEPAPDTQLPAKSHNTASLQAAEHDRSQSNPDGSLTPSGLSWRLFHLSRAKLRATSSASELLFGFAMIALVELQINQPTKVPEGLFILFAASSTVLVGLHIFALTISTYILPNIDVVTRLHPSALLEESPHHRMRTLVEVAWGFSTVLGMFMFLFEVTLLAWMKFWDYAIAASIMATLIMIPSIAIFVGFAGHFYRTLVLHKCEVTDMDLQQLEDMRKKLDTTVTTTQPKDTLDKEYIR